MPVVKKRIFVEEKHIQMNILYVKIVFGLEAGLAHAKPVPYVENP